MKKDTNAVSVISEAAVILALQKIGVNVSRPISPVKYDLIADIPSEGLRRIQVKTGRLKEGIINSNWSQVYEDDDIDYVAIYCPELDRCYMIAWQEMGSWDVTFRIDPPKKPSKKTRYAEDYEIR